MPVAAITIAAAPGLRRAVYPLRRSRGIL